MALILNDRVRETTAVTGTGSATLLGAVTGYQSFSTIGNGNTTYYTIADQGGPNWEVGLGTYSSGTLARTTVLSSSNSGSLVNFTAGTKDVFVTQPSEKAVYLDGSGNITPSSVGPLTVSSLTDSALTSGRVTYAGTAGLLQDSANLTFNGTTLTANTLNLTNALTTSYGGTGLTSFTAGDLPYYSTGTALSKLAIGTNGYILQSNGSAPTWVNASSVSTAAGGSNTQVQYNSSGLLAGSANLTFNGTTLTTANDASISGLTVGKGGGAQTYATVFGTGALASNTTGYGTAIGYNAGNANITGTAFTAVGAFAGQAATGGLFTAIGQGSLSSLTTGTYNVAVGLQDASGVGAMRYNTTGSFNSAFGTGALGNNTTASYNTAVGYQAGYSNQTGIQNVYVGRGAAYAATGSYNTCIGDSAGASLTTGASNTFVGGGSASTASGYFVTTGSKNTILGTYTGNQGGLDIRTASNYIVLSDGDGNPRGIFDSSGNLLVGTVTTTGTPVNGVILGQNPGAIYIGHPSGTASGTQYANFNYNGGSIGSITQNGTTAVLYNITSDYRLKTDVTPITNALSTVEALNPVSFKWTDGRPDDGFIAHELQAVLPNCVTGEKDAIRIETYEISPAISAELDEDGNVTKEAVEAVMGEREVPVYQQMDNSGVIPFLVKAIQELNVKLEAQADLITTMQAKLKDAGVLGF